MVTKYYSLPNKTAPGLDFSYFLSDLIEIKNIIESRGIRTKNTRIERYIQYYDDIVNERELNESSIFKNSKNGPFQHSLDWHLYLLREAHELMWILKGLKNHIPKGIDDKLKIIVAGSDFAVLDGNSLSRNTQFELRIASYFCQAGFEVDLSTETDIIASSKEYTYFIECKRVASIKMLMQRIDEAKKQILLRKPKNTFKKIYSAVAVDVTKIAYEHNGLTWGVTYDHTKDIIQDKLKSISEQIRNNPIFQNNINLLCLWMQIHIPSLVMQPPTNITRFSSYTLINPKLKRQDKNAWDLFKNTAEIGRLGDEREVPPQDLKLRKQIIFPAGTAYKFAEDILDELVRTTKAGERAPEFIVLELEMEGAMHKFTFYELELLLHQYTKKDIERITGDKTTLRSELLAGLYAQRYPYEDTVDI